MNNMNKRRITTLLRINFYIKFRKFRKKRDLSYKLTLTGYSLKHSFFSSFYAQIEHHGFKSANYMSQKRHT